MIRQLPSIPPALQALPTPPRALFYRGNLDLLERPKIAIVGTRHPNSYTKAYTKDLATLCRAHGLIVVSGGAIGVDVLAHAAAFPETILLSPSSLDLHYPKIHGPLIEKIATQGGLLLSEYESGFMPRRYSFLERNRLVIGLSDAVVIPQADLRSGSMQSARVALSLQKPLFVLPHRLGESEGTQSLLESHQAHALYRLEEILKPFGIEPTQEQESLADPLLLFCRSLPAYSEALEKFGAQLFEYELSGKIEIVDGRVKPLCSSQ